MMTLNEIRYNPASSAFFVSSWPRFDPAFAFVEGTGVHTESKGSVMDLRHSEISLTTISEINYIVRITLFRTLC